jgi:hypothetical protein
MSMPPRKRPDPFARFFRELDSKMREDGTVLPVPIGTKSYLERMNAGAGLPTPDWAVAVNRPNLSDELMLAARAAIAMYIARRASDSTEAR